MRSLIFLLILSGLLYQACCRPPLYVEEEKNGEEDESQYEDEEAEDDDANLNEEQGSEEEADKCRQSPYSGRNVQQGSYEEQPSSDLYERRQKNALDPQRRNSYGLSDSKAARVKENYALNTKSKEEYAKNQDSGIFFEKGDDNHVKDAPNTRQVKRYGFSALETRKADSSDKNSNEKGDLFLREVENEDKNSATNDYNNEASDNEQEPNLGHYQLSAEFDHRLGRLSSQRDRRGVNDSEQTTLGPETTAEKNCESGDEEIAIKKHVQKLSTEEFNDLLNSLSEDKKTLLRQILGSDVDSSLENINKREITKKAGAVEENNLVEGNQFESSNSQASSVSAECLSSSTASSTESKLDSSTDKAKVAPISSDSSNGRIESKSDLATAIDENRIISNADSAINLESQSPSKVEMKRDTYSKESNILLSDDLSYKIRSEDGKNKNEVKLAGNDKDYLVQESNMNTNDVFSSKNSKRDTYSSNDADYFNSYKSLEESFPNSYDESGTYVGPSAGPLIRVKRKDSDTIKKRAATLLSDAKVAYFPCKSENEEEEYNEGNEFNDDGFYDRTANIANENSKVHIPVSNIVKLHPKLSHNTITKPEADIQQNEHLESDTSVGSDTDSVLSGADGVDDTLMYNSGLKNNQVRMGRSTPLIDDEMETASNNYINAQSCHDNDAFGPLPRSYEGELGRFKRIRHAKQSSVPEEMNITN